MDRDALRSALEILVRDVVAGARLDLVESLFAVDAHVGRSLGGSVDGFQASQRGLHSTFPTLEAKINDIAVDGDRVFGWITWTGRDGQGRSFTADDFTRIVVRDDRIAEIDQVFDMWTARQQLAGTATEPLSHPGPAS